MNILQIVSSSRISGAEKHVVVLSDRLMRLGHNVLAVCPRGGWLPGKLRDATVPSMELNFRGPSVVRCASEVLRYARSNQVDLIHTHLTKATYIGYIVARLTGLPLVSTLHTRTSDLVYRRLMPGPNRRIITVSNFLRDMLIRQGIPPWMMTTIYNGTEFIEESENRTPPESECLRPHLSFQESGSPVYSEGEAVLPLSCRELGSGGAVPLRAELGLPRDAELIGLFGHVGDQKGHPLLVQAARAIVERRPRAYFVFVGPTDARMQTRLGKMAAADGVADRIRYTGPRDDIPSLMDAMDVVTVPSEIESFGLVIIEAMARSKPVVAARVGGIPEVITHCETGLLVDRNPAELADALAGLLEDPEARARIGRQGRELAAARFSAATMACNVAIFYRSMLARSGNGSMVRS